METNKKLSFVLLLILASLIVIITSSCGNINTTNNGTEAAKAPVNSSSPILTNTTNKYTNCKIKTFVGQAKEYISQNISEQVNNWLSNQSTRIQVIDIQICDSSGEDYRSPTSTILIVYKEVTK